MKHGLQLNTEKIQHTDDIKSKLAKELYKYKHELQWEICDASENAMG